MGLEYLGIFPVNYNKPCGAFICGKQSLLELKSKKIIIFGAGEFGRYSLYYLRENGIEPSYFCDNNRSKWGEDYLGKTVLKPTDAYKLENVYFIISISTSDTLVRQILLHGETNFSEFFIAEIGSFTDRILWKYVLSSINQLAEVVFMRVPLFADSYHLYENTRYIPLRIYREMLGAVLSWDLGLSSLVNKLNQENKVSKKLLDIGPGVGLLSHILCSLYPDISTTWISYSSEHHVGHDFIDSINMHFPIERIFGVLENPNFILNRTFDIIVFANVMEHLQCNPVPTIKKIASMLAPDGYIVVITPTSKGDILYNYDSYEELPLFSDKKDYDKFLSMGSLTYFDASFSHNYIYEKKDLIEIFNQADLEVIEYAVNLHERHNIILRHK